MVYYHTYYGNYNLESQNGNIYIKVYIFNKVTVLYIKFLFLQFKTGYTPH